MPLAGEPVKEDDVLMSGAWLQYGYRAAAPRFVGKESCEIQKNMVSSLRHGFFSAYIGEVSFAAADNTVLYMVSASIVIRVPSALLDDALTRSWAVGSHADGKTCTQFGWP